MLKRIRIYTLVTAIHHIIILVRKAKVGVHLSDELQRFVATTGGDNGICGSNGWNDVFDYALGHGVGYAWDVEFLGAG